MSAASSGPSMPEFDARESADFMRYLKRHRAVREVFITGGDPLIRNTRDLAGCSEPPGMASDCGADIRIRT